MSNALAIAAATATLRNLLIQKLGISDVTARALDKARDNISGDQVNLFLYQTTVDPAWRNMDMPRQTKPGESGQPPLPLALYYLLTAYSDDTDDVKSQILLGRAMSVLHDHPLLDKTEIENASSGVLATSDLHEQLERVRITHEPLPLEELSKLWTAFQTNYRTSAAYQVSVVLIESTRPAKAPLPVLTRGKDDTGVASQPDVTAPIPPFPMLLGIGLPAGQTSARLGDLLTLTGNHLDGAPVTVRLSNPHLAAPSPVTINDQTATAIEIQLDDTPVAWVAGLYTVAVEIGTGADLQTTNELPLTIAPRITSVPPPLDVQRQADQSAAITLKTSPQVLKQQRASLLLGDREIPAEPHPASTDTLTFAVKKAPLGTHFLRLRINGVDSLLIQRPPGQPPVFDLDQRVTIHD